jgi:hypothetical protein
MPPTIYLIDLNLLVNIGGRERTRADFEQLCAEAGFTLSEIHPLPHPPLSRRSKPPGPHSGCTLTTPGVDHERSHPHGARDSADSTSTTGCRVPAQHSPTSVQASGGVRST